MVNNKEDFKNIIKRWAEEKPFIEHVNYKKCGQCYKEYIKHLKAKEFVLKEKYTLKEFFDAVDNDFKKTLIFKKYQKLKKTGLDHNSIEKIMEKDGFIL